MITTNSFRDRQAIFRIESKAPKLCSTRSWSVILLKLCSSSNIWWAITIRLILSGKSNRCSWRSRSFYLPVTLIRYSFTETRNLLGIPSLSDSQICFKKISKIWHFSSIMHSFSRWASTKQAWSNRCKPFKNLLKKNKASAFASNKLNSTNWTNWTNWIRAALVYGRNSSSPLTNFRKLISRWSFRIYQPR